MMFKFLSQTNLILEMVFTADWKFELDEKRIVLIICLNNIICIPTPTSAQYLNCLEIIQQIGLYLLYMYFCLCCLSSNLRALLMLHRFPSH